ncbi:LytTR family DNA-binding domain-containing protein [Parabacteroides sp. PF5-9]|uniref:LytR/AlgR family response regulator transcription factor n=1 Tax=Parabacteroides sp. PF5-9 TaxID=1742404 RepID=UPI00247626AB|nr:LytTR family DNA-binding domain-containing protein [Parabacteroides sp. PF5-9]MDH6356866.1 hypothetical protein [Parabacteroides sp. PF5-9]
MLPHPFTESFNKKLTGILLVFAVIVVQWGLFVYYTDMPSQIALTDSVITISLLATAGFFMWYMIHFVSVWQAHVLIAILSQVICLGVSFTVLLFLDMEDMSIFRQSLPLRLLIGILSWIILLQWYQLLLKNEKLEVEKTERIMAQEAEHKAVLDKISIKDGARIHIIHLNELCCIQASGDYVTFFTHSGQYIKEQTMKYYETHLPAESFVRIHRSSIVNTEYILRVELFRKDSYHVKLKNGMSLKASNSGYKLLKERLSL